VLLVAAACFHSTAQAADIVVVDDNARSVFWGYYGAAAFADQPEDLWDDTVAWAVANAIPDCTNILLYTFDGTTSDTAPQNTHSIAFYNLLTTAGYHVAVDNQLNFATRTDYTGIDLIIFGNFGYADAAAPNPANAIGSGLPFITMEPGHSDDLGIGTGVTVFSGTLNYGFVVDNDHPITDVYGLGDIILLDQNSSPGAPLFDVPTDGITSDGRILIGDIPEPATALLVVLGLMLGRGRLRRRR